ncbi:MAG: DUF4465 domain-containing protein [Alistipes sp.]|nr:DUF4465 domain-containing protein [Alistipes sp.]
MKKLFTAMLLLVSATACNKNEDFTHQTTEPLVLTGYCAAESRTHFGTPGASQIPYFWSKGDYIWLGSVQSNPLAEDCRQAQFVWNNPPSTIGAFHLFYNMTGSNKTAKVLANQSADGNLGNDGDFGYAVADEFGIFCLDHKTSYIWFDTKSNEQLPQLTSIAIKAADGLALAGECVFDYENNAWESSVVNGTNQITLDFGEGVALQSANEGVFAAMVTLPAAIGGTELTVVYTFADGSTYSEVKQPQKDLTAGDTQRISTTIALADLVQPEPELSYELRILTFEDEDVKFDPIENFAFAYPDYMGGYWYGDYFTLTKWSDYIPRDGQYGNGHRSYEWYDANNTELEFVWPSEDSWWGIAGHAGISDYVGTMDDVNSFHDDNMLYMIDLQAYNVKGGANGSKNFCSQYGYLDPDEYATTYSPEGVLPGIQFHDGVARVIDHMYVTNTTYAYGVIIHGECDFGGSFKLTDASTFKIVAYGYDSFDDTEPTITDFYLLNTGQRFVTDWTKWDLSVLGKVVRVEFNLVACDNGYGKYGLVIPAYFAYDDVAVRFEK